MSEKQSGVLITAPQFGTGKETVGFNGNTRKPDMLVDIAREMGIILTRILLMSG